LYKNSVRNFNITRAQENTKSLISARFKNAKLYWKLLKEGVVTNKPTKISCDTFLKYFEAINNPSDVFFQPDEDVIHFNENFLNTEAQIMFKELDLPFTSEELKSAISELSNGRSAGPDGVINEILIHGYYAFEQYLLNLFNKILESGYFPNSWSEGYIVPVHKKGSMDDVNNFRGITLLSTIGKLFTKLLNKRLSNWAEDYYVYTESQAGFRSKMGTNDNIFVLHGLVQHMINKNEALYCSFIDFSKCFDYLVHHNIWFKLTKLGIRGKIYTVIKSMYNCIKSRIKLENRVSIKFFECLLGVRQGESLSPFLFTMYVNDLEEELYLNGFEGVDINNFKMFLLLYADDIVLLSKTPVDLQNGLNVLENYCQRWKLKVNIEKTKIMVFGKGRLPNNLRFTYGGQPLEIVNKFCYLGIVFTRGGSFVEAQNTLVGQAQKAIYKMKKCLYRFTHIGVKHTMDMFDKLIVPILHYGCQTWGLNKTPSIERLHMHFCKNLLGVKSCTQNDFVYGELGRIDLYTVRLYTVIKYWLKILATDDRKYIRKLYNTMLSDIHSRPNKKNWASDVRDILNSTGFSQVWLNQGIGDESVFLSIFKCRIKDMYIQNWRARLDLSSRAIFYRNFTNFEFKNYLEQVNSEKFRTALTRLRVSSHRLCVETGRWKQPVTPFSERLCQICSKLEDEYHFLFECPLYDNLRKQFIKPYYLNRSNMFKCLELLQSDNKKINRNLAMYVHKAFSCRNAYLQL
jgi:hypothetical protein